MSLKWSKPDLAKFWLSAVCDRAKRLRACRGAPICHTSIIMTYSHQCIVLTHETGKQYVT